MPRKASIGAEIAGLRRGAALLAEFMRQLTKSGGPGFPVPSEKIPPTIRSYVRGGIGYINAGGPGGRAAPNAYMFETLGARHPLFARGPRGTDGWKHWYTQPYRPFMEIAAEDHGDEAAQAFADTAIRIWAQQLGYDYNR